tara:strand:+ start:1137 stop:1322 length:186 start_codon:yes stop_codon:yes gene_type:complete
MSKVSDVEITINGVKVEGFARADEVVVVHSDYTSLERRVLKLEQKLLREAASRYYPRGSWG